MWQHVDTALQSYGHNFSRMAQKHINRKISAATGQRGRLKRAAAQEVRKALLNRTKGQLRNEAAQFLEFVHHIAALHAIRQAVHENATARWHHNNVLKENMTPKTIGVIRSSTETILSRLKERAAGLMTRSSQRHKDAGVLLHTAIQETERRMGGFFK